MTLSVRNAVERILAHPDRRRLTTLESIVSLPIPRDGTRRIGVFFHALGNLQTGRKYRVPYCIAEASIDTGEVSVRRVSPLEVGFDLAPGTVLGHLDPPPPEAGPDVDRKVYLDGVDALLVETGLRLFSAANVIVTPRLGSSFVAAALAPMLPAYRALNARFVDELTTYGRR